jgi:hypothetical protein
MLIVLKQVAQRQAGARRRRWWRVLGTTTGGWIQPALSQHYDIIDKDSHDEACNDLLSPRPRCLWQSLRRQTMAKKKSSLQPFIT